LRFASARCADTVNFHLRPNNVACHATGIPPLSAAPRPESGTLNKVAEALSRGDFDYIGAGRALLSDPEWVRKIQ